MAIILRPTGQTQARHGGNRRQRLAAKAQTRHALQLFQTADFAGGVTRQRQQQFVARDTATIVGNADTLGAALLKVDPDLGRARVEAVFQQLF